MIPELREKYNAEFSPERYRRFLDDLWTINRGEVDFRVCETPLFLQESICEQLVSASKDITVKLQSEAFKQHCLDAVPKNLTVPNQDAHTTFLQIDFALCQDASGDFYPQLIELQGFPSVYGFQAHLDEKIKAHFDLARGLGAYFSDHNRDSYLDLLRQAVIGESDPERTILLEIRPESQKTRIDFACTEHYFGIKPVCLSKIIKRGQRLFYKKENQEIPIERVYNRVISDELQGADISYNFSFQDDLDVKWVGHPHWFYKISKHSLPFFDEVYAPKSYFLSELDHYPDDLENYVLKPLYSFAGSGVKIDATAEKLDSVSDRDNYILQEKIAYDPLILTPDDPAKVEVRMMFIWIDEPILVNNLVRVGKGKMMGVNFNKDKVWVGATAGYHF
ncbi:MAG: hypothetical protein B6244_10425 [Candidatus Cloacimonetes bacterium 4572_55]|nr:MAG: hypothetical protein B6244_10425 [Candidatus Cloacimonetes bacterium 4572_55]